MTVDPVFVTVDPANTAKLSAVPRMTVASAAITLTGDAKTAQIRSAIHIDINRKTLFAFILIKAFLSGDIFCCIVVVSDGLTTLAIAIFSDIIDTIIIP
ncbi:MAG: hypothetical protein SCM11_05395 [Bacillota bacterium]|nr:hypothetical protein [Bacillota bacterium]